MKPAQNKKMAYNKPFFNYFVKQSSTNPQYFHRFTLLTFFFVIIRRQVTSPHRQYQEAHTGQ